MCAITFCEAGANCQGSCAVSSHNGIEDSLNASNGQSCYWFNNGCVRETRPAPALCATALRAASEDDGRR
jgi:hypothetical protein